MYQAVYYYLAFSLISKFAVSSLLLISFKNIVFLPIELVLMKNSHTLFYLNTVIYLFH